MNLMKKHLVFLIFLGFFSCVAGICKGVGLC